MKVGRSIIIGIGNSFRGDDGAGLVAARMLRERALRDTVVLESDGDPASLIEAWTGADAAFIIDAVSSGAAPGSLHVIDARRKTLDGDLFRHSTHAFGVAEAVEISRTLETIPPVFWVYGIEGRDFRPGSTMSPEAIQGVAKAVEALLGKLIESGIEPTND
jgi:hydrogenase maturation protease